MVHPAPSPAFVDPALAGSVSTPIARLAGRVLLLDPGGRILLVHEVIHTGHPHWLTPGGGVESDEGPAAAAVREVFEETGIVIELPIDAEPILIQHDVWSMPPPSGLTYDQTNHFFAATVPVEVVARPQALTELEQRTHLGLRWWTVAELRATTEVVYPANLADLVDGVLGRPRPAG